MLMESSFGQAELSLHSRLSLVFSAWQRLPKADLPSLQARLAPAALLLELITGEKDASPCSLFVTEVVAFEVPYSQQTFLLQVGTRYSASISLSLASS